MFLVAIGACIFIDDAEHAAFVATLGGEADGDTDADSDSDTDIDSGDTGDDTAVDTGTDTGLEPDCGPGQGCTVSTEGRGYYFDGEGVLLGASVAALDLDEDGNDEVLATGASPGNVVVAFSGTGGSVGERTLLDDLGFARFDASMPSTALGSGMGAVGSGSARRLLVGDPLSTLSGGPTGAVWLFDEFDQGAHGDAGGVVGEADADEAGTAVATYDEGELVAVGAPRFDNCGTVYAGAWDVEEGAAGVIVADFASLYSGGAWHKLVAGCSDGPYGLGRELAWGDFDGNGVADLAVAAPIRDPDGVENAGYVYVIADLLYTEETPYVDDMVAAGSAIGIAGGNVDDGFGTALAVLDLDGNGDDDLAVGNPGFDDLGTERGQVAIFDDLANPGDYAEADDANIKYTGSDDDQALGQDLAPVGERAWPGLAVLAGSQSAWILPGAGEWTSSTIGDVPGVATYDAGELGALAEIAGGDFDGNGVVDLLVGAPGDDGPAGAFADAGSAWVILLGQ